MYWDRDLLNAMAVLICCEILKNRKTIEHLYQQLALLVLVKIIVACMRHVCQIVIGCWFYFLCYHQFIAMGALFYSPVDFTDASDLNPLMQV